MNKRFVFLRDCDHPLLEGDNAHVLGVHDSPDEDPHCHYTVLEVDEEGRAIVYDWGYHTLEEAKAAVE